MARISRKVSGELLMVPALDLGSESHLASIDSTAAATSSALTACMQRKSIGHSRRKQGLHSTWCRKTVCPLPSGPVRSVFFFQAEDGIRAVAVTGVQTCALPI